MRGKTVVVAVVLAIITSFYLLKIYLPITGMIVDAESGKPIEGAVVLIEWTKTHGIGEHWTESYRVVEITSDKDGKVKMEGCYDLFVNEPDVTIYKNGYVAWNNKFIFPSYKVRTAFSWRDYTFKLEHFKPEYLHNDHITFIHGAIHLGSGRKKIIFDAIATEETRAFNERKKEWNK